MKNKSGSTLRRLIFWALCCALGIFAKKLIAPAANLITGWLHIPGGIGTAFSLMFPAVAAALAPYPFCCTLMAGVQSAIALSLGSVGSMGILSPLGYLLPGLAMDTVFSLSRRLRLPLADTLVFVNAVGSVAAAWTANAIVFHLRGLILLVYTCTAAFSGTVFGLLGGTLSRKLRPVIDLRGKNKEDSP